MGKYEKNQEIFLPAVWLIVIIAFHRSNLIQGALIKDLVILDELLSRGYDRRATPTNHLGNATPTVVFCELFVRSFGSPNPLTMDYKVDLYLRQKWKDERLKHKDWRQPLDLNDPNLVKAIWKPEVYFPNGKEADFQFVTVPNFLLRIYPNGDILYMLRLKVTFSCLMDLSKFPLDRQKCTMQVASFSKTMDELILEWKKEEPVTLASLGMSQFEMVGIDTAKCPSSESFGQIGNYSCIVASFHLSRSLGFHLVQSYLPTILMVVISWVSFWMDVNSVPGRVTLGITTLLTVSHKSTNIQENLPQSSYVKAIDVWMGTCTGFVFLALLEFTVVNYLWRMENHHNYWRTHSSSNHHHHNHHQSHHHHQEGRNNRDEVEGYDHSHSPTTPAAPAGGRGATLIQVKEEGGMNHLQARFIVSGSRAQSVISDHPIHLDAFQFRFLNFQIKASGIDETCRFAFPLAFATFNCVYWPYYLLT